MIRLDLDDPPRANGPGGRQFLYPEALYLDRHGRVRLDNAFVRYTVRQPAGAPVIDFDTSTGSLKPVRRGDALLETSYSGVVKRTCIQVGRASEPFDRGTCRQLRAATAPSPLSTTRSQDRDGFASEFFDRQTGFHTERIEVTAPDRPVEIAQPLEMPVEISGGELLNLGFYQLRSGVDDPMLGNISSPGKRTNLNQGVADIVRDEGSSKTVEIIPLALGEEKVATFGRFKDHGFSAKYFGMRAVPSSNGLKSIQLHDWPAPDGRRLRASLQYRQLEGDVELRTLDGFKLKVEQPADAPVLRVDPDGLVHELGAGDAVIVAEFEDLTTRYWMRACFCSAAPARPGSTGAAGRKQ